MHPSSVTSWQVAPQAIKRRLFSRKSFTCAEGINRSGLVSKREKIMLTFTRVRHSGRFNKTFINPSITCIVGQPPFRTHLANDVKIAT